MRHTETEKGSRGYIVSRLSVESTYVYVVLKISFHESELFAYQHGPLPNVRGSIVHGLVVSDGRLLRVLTKLLIWSNLGRVAGVRRRSCWNGRVLALVVEASLMLWWDLTRRNCLIPA